jgi:parallel beta-helix repeat protein
VTLDLNGFAIRCAWVFTPCKGTGTGDGIYSVTVEDVTVRNGMVYDMADNGIEVHGQGAVVQNVRALNNGGYGIDVGSGGLIEKCTALGNGGSYGITVGGGGIVRDSTATDNDQFGIAGSYGALLIGDTASDHVNGTGLVCSNCTIQDSTAYGNKKGIGANDSLIRNNTVSLNANDGVSGTGAAVIGNRIVDNGGFGIHLGGTYGGNTITGNNSGAEIQSNSAGVEIDTNFCGTDTVCP